MSKQLLKEVFLRMVNCRAWSLSILKIKNTKRVGTSYFSRDVNLKPPGKLNEFVQSIHEYYCSPEGIDSISSVDEYAGDLVDQVVYRLDSNNSLINDQYDKIIQSIATPDLEVPASYVTSNAVVLKGNVNVNGNDLSVLPFSMHRPVISLSNKYLWLEGHSFHEISRPVLTLRKKVDVAIVGNMVYLFNQAGEKLFNLERSYKILCRKHVEEIVKCGFLSDTEAFSRIANSGRNPRRFISYNNEHLDWLKVKENREYASKKFDISLEGEMINTKDQNSVDKLVKFLCNKAMIDPCNEAAYEVTSPKQWS